VGQDASVQLAVWRNGGVTRTNWLWKFELLCAAEISLEAAADAKPLCRWLQAGIFFDIFLKKWFLNRKKEVILRLSR
jgi:hypothetical protein